MVGGEGPVIRKALLLVSLLLTLGAMPVHADVVTVNDLIEQAQAFDAKEVTVQGEVFGDVMIRGDMGWINVSDGTGDIGVWATADDLRKIQSAGRYHHSGDQVRVTGEFRRADPEHGGDLVLRAASLEILEAGTPSDHPVKPGRPVLAAISLVLAAVLGYIRFRGRVEA